MSEGEKGDMNISDQEIEDLEVAHVAKSDLKRLLIDFQVQSAETAMTHKIVSESSSPLDWSVRKEIDSRLLEGQALIMAGVAGLIQIQVNHKEHFGEQ